MDSCNTGFIQCGFEGTFDLAREGFICHFMFVRRAAEVLYSLTLANVQKYGQPSEYPTVDNYKLLTEARRNLGLFQHHDAITGTGKDWVVVDYGTR